MRRPDIERIEQELGFALPKPYREFLGRFPAEVANARIIYNDGSVSEPQRDLFSEPDLVIWHTQHIPGDEPKVWKGLKADTYVVIGNDGCGNYFLVKRESATDKVYVYDHDYAKTMPVGRYDPGLGGKDSIWNFARRIVQRFKARLESQRENVVARLAVLEQALVELDALDPEKFTPEDNGRMVRVHNAIDSEYHARTSWGLAELAREKGAAESVSRIAWQGCRDSLQGLVDAAKTVLGAGT